MRRRGRITAAVLVAAALAAGGVAWRRRTSPPPSAPPPRSAAPSSRDFAAAERAAAPPLPVAPSGSAAPTSAVERLKAFTAAVARAETNAALEVDAALRNGGGAAALALIRERVFRRDGGEAERLSRAFLARLIPHCARRDGSCASAALALARELLRSPDLDPDARLQAAAGLGGVRSSKGVAYAREGQAPRFVFTPRTDDEGGEPGPYDDSLAEAARADGAAAAELLRAFEGDPSPDVRRVAALGLPQGGTPGWEAALRAATLGDPDPALRGAAFEILARAGAAGLETLARDVVRRPEQTPEAQAAALGVIARAAAADPESRRFLVRCLETGAPPDARAALTRHSIELLAGFKDPELQGGLTTLLLRHAGEDEALVDSFVEEVVARGWTAYQPLFRAIASSLAGDSEARRALEEGARKLDEAPRFVELAARARENEARVRALWSEIVAPGTSEARKAELREKIGALTRELWELQERR